VLLGGKEFKNFEALPMMMVFGVGHVTVSWSENSRGTGKVPPRFHEFVRPLLLRAEKSSVNVAIQMSTTLRHCRQTTSTERYLKTTQLL
jgi:hypothetical protein